MHETPKRVDVLGAVALSPDVELRQAVVSAFHSAINQGIGFAGRMQSAQSLALREYRNSLLWARAIVRLSAPILSTRAAKRIDSTLKLSYQATALVREADSLSGLLDRLDAGDAHSQLSQLRSQLMTWRLSRYDDRRIASALLTGIVSIRGLPDQLDKSLPPQVLWSDVVYGVRLTYEKARKHYGRASAVPDRVHVRRLEASARDLRLQLELLAPSVSAAATRRPKLRKCLRPLSRAVRLYALREHAQRLLPDADAEALSQRLDELAERRVAKALRRAQKFFAMKPSKLANKLHGDR